MALLLSDGFDSHGTGAATLSDGDPSWGSQSGVEIAAGAGRYGGKVLYLEEDTAGSVSIMVSPVGSTLAVAAHYKVSASSGTVELLIDGAGPLLERTSSGGLRVRDGAGVELVSADGALPDDTWGWVEVVFAPTAISLYLEGDLIGSYSGAYTYPDVGSLALLDGGVGNGDTWVDDILVWDDSGSYFNTFGILPRRIQLLEPSADGKYSQWVSQGSDPNWASVNAPDWAGGDGVQATEDGQRDSYRLSDLASSPGLIDAVVVKVRAESTGGTHAALKVLSILGTEAQSSPIPVPSSPGPLKSTLYTDPNGVSWTSTTVRETEFGINLVANGS